MYYYLLAISFSLLIGKIGAATNYYIEPVISIIVFVAASSNEIIKKKQLISITFMLLTISQFVIYSQNIALAPNIEDFSNKTQLLNYLERLDGKVLCEDAAAAVISHKGPAIDWFLLTQIFRNNLWDEREFVNKILQNNFTHLILEVNIQSSSEQCVEQERFSCSLLKELEHYFNFKEKIDNYYIYVRKQIFKFV